MFNKCYSQYYELFNKDKKYKKEIELVYKLAGEPKRILDVGCGTANYWKYFPTNAFLIGVEKSEAMKNLSKHRDYILTEDIKDYKSKLTNFNAVTALFDVVNYIPKHDWWKNLPLEKGGSFVFDIWDKEKVDKDGFKQTVKTVGDVTRTITPVVYDGKKVTLNVAIMDNGLMFQEMHTMYVWSIKDIEKFCGNEFEITEVKETKHWQCWVKCVKK